MSRLSTETEADTSAPTSAPTFAPTPFDAAGTNHLDLQRGVSSTMFYCSIFSIIGPMSIIVTFLLFPKLKKKLSLQVIVCRAIADMLSAVGTAPGEQYSGTSLCWFVGIFSNVFQLASCFWTVVISFMLWFVLHTGRSPHVHLWVHAWCWLGPIFISMIPLVNITYGSPYAPESGYCWVAENADGSSPKWAIEFWGWMSFYFWIWACIILILIFFFMMIKEFQHIEKHTIESVGHVIEKLRLYPLIIFCCWVFTCATDLNDGLYAMPGVPFLAVFLPCMQGVFTTTAFWVTDDDARGHWLHLYRSGWKDFKGTPKGHLKKKINVDGTVNTSASGNSSSKGTDVDGPLSSLSTHSSHMDHDSAKDLYAGSKVAPE